MASSASSEVERDLLNDRRKQPRLSLALFGVERRHTTDRRTRPRLKLELGCEGETEDGTWFFRLSCDLSLSGMAFASGLPLPVGTQLSLKIPLPDGQEAFPVRGHAVGPHGRHGGVRVAFEALTPEQTVRLAEALVCWVSMAHRH
jgi:hypothetical protein